MLTRRKFAGLVLAGAGAVTSLTSTVACTFGSVYTAISKYVGIGLQALQAVLAIAGPFIPMSGVLTLVIAEVKAGFADVQTFVNQYEAAPAADKTTWIGKISVALGDLEADLRSFWNDLNIPDSGKSSLIESLIGFIVSALMGFQSQLPPVQASAKKLKAEKLQKKLSVSAVKLSPSEFKARFNAKLKQNGESEVRFH